MRKKIVCTMLALTMTAGILAGCGSTAGNTAASGKDGPSAESTRIWKFAHTRAEGTDNDIMANEFADSLMSSLDGLQIEMYPNNQLGDYTVVQEAVGMGDVQLMLGSMSNGVDPTLSVQITPYLVSNWDEAYDWYNSEDGLLYRYVAERLELQNIHLLAVMPKYFGGIMTTQPVSNIEDPSASKGVKIRVPQMKSFETFASSIGFQTTPLPTSDTFTSLQTGVVNGACGGGTEQYWSDYGELAKYIYQMRTHMENHWLYMSMDTWNTLSADEQAAVTKLAKTWESEAFDLARENETKYADLFTQKGVEVYTPTEEVVQAYADYVRTNVWPEISSEYGDIWNKITAKIQG